jgi:hypothetical protein
MGVGEDGEGQNGLRVVGECMDSEAIYLAGVSDCRVDGRVAMVEWSVGECSIVSDLGGRTTAALYDGVQAASYMGLPLRYAAISCEIFACKLAAGLSTVNWRLVLEADGPLDSVSL